MPIVESIHGEFLRYKALAEAAIAQTADAELSRDPAADGNSIATICAHISGNLQSRFTDFLTTDGEKPWRRRDDEFLSRQVTRADLLASWDAGWAVLFATLSQLDDTHLGRTVTIRGQALRVDEALHRALAHAAYHCGQIVLLAKNARGTAWRSLSIPRGASSAFNQNPSGQRPDEHAAALGKPRP